MKRANLILIAVFFLSMVQFGSVLAKELVKVTLRGPGLTNEVEIADTERLDIFRRLEFANQIARPASAETEPHFEFYLAVGEGTEIVATDVYYYYPATKYHPSYIYYADVLNGWSSIEGQYFLLSQDNDRAIMNLLVGLGAALPDRENRFISEQTEWLALSIILLTGLALGASIAIKRKKSVAA